MFLVEDGIGYDTYGVAHAGHDVLEIPPASQRDCLMTRRKQGGGGQHLVQKGEIVGRRHLCHVLKICLCQVIQIKAAFCPLLYVLIQLYSAFKALRSRRAASSVS